MEIVAISPPATGKFGYSEIQFTWAMSDGIEASM